jgi:hypothetical protein
MSLLVPLLFLAAVSTGKLGAGSFVTNVIGILPFAAVFSPKQRLRKVFGRERRRIADEASPRL